MPDPAIEPLMAVLVGVFFAAAVYMLMDRSLIRLLLGVVVLGNAANLMIFTAGRIVREVPPIVPVGQLRPEGLIANPLPQALVLTAIVIGFAVLAFTLVLVYRTDQSLGTDDSAEMRVAEPPDQGLPPSGY